MSNYTLGAERGREVGWEVRHLFTLFVSIKYHDRLFRPSKEYVQTTSYEHTLRQDEAP